MLRAARIRKHCVLQVKLKCFSIDKTYNFITVV